MFPKWGFDNQICDLKTYVMLGYLSSNVQEISMVFLSRRPSYPVSLMVIPLLPLEDLAAASPPLYSDYNCLVEVRLSRSLDWTEPSDSNFSDPPSFSIVQSSTLSKMRTSPCCFSASALSSSHGLQQWFCIKIPEIEEGFSN